MSGNPDPSTARIKQRLYEIMFVSAEADKASKAFNLGMLTLISLNVVAVILETEPALYRLSTRLFDTFELFSILVFTIEYILRVWVCTIDQRFASPIVGRIRYLIQPLAIVDLIAFLPFYLPLGMIDLRFIRAVRLFRLFRIFKMGRYSQSLTTLGNVFKAKKEELGITLFAGFLLLVIASSVMYLVEHEAQPDNFSSIPSAMWWAAITLTTVGYGDIYPQTILGKFLGAFIAILGIGLFALPAGIIASGFVSELQEKNAKEKICPHCGKDINSPPERNKE